MVGTGVFVGGAGVRVGCGVGRSVGVGLGEGVGDGVGVGVNDGSGRGVKSAAVGLGLVDGAAAGVPGTNDRAAPATMRPMTMTTRSVAMAFPNMNDV